MPRYSYTAISATGELQQGTLDADSKEAAQQILADLELTTQTLCEVSDESEAEPDKSTQPTWDVPAADVAYTEAAAQPQPIDWSKQTPPKEPASDVVEYHPFIDTARLYAGWLLAWYIAVYALGSYQQTRELPFELPYVQAFLPPYSPLVLTFALASFLFLLISSVRRALPAGKLVGLLCYVLGIAIFVVYRANV